jgi:L-iditol 2-dehydrogenase
MRFAKFTGAGNIQIVEADLPVPNAQEVLLRVLACSLCGSDARPFKLGWPVTPGHEIVGEVDQPGHALHRKRCLVYIPVWCGHCELCLNQQTHLCENATDLIGWQRPGGYAEAVLVPTQCLLPVPDDIPTHLAPLLLDTIGTAAHGVRLASRLVQSGRVLIMGLGPIGLGALLVLQHFGYQSISAFDPNPLRLETALTLGAKPFDSDQRTSFTLILECSGKDQARQQALEWVAPGGVVIQLGEADAWNVQETKAIRRKDFFYVRSFYFPISEYKDNLDILRNDMDRFNRLVDGKVPLEGLQNLFAQFFSGQKLKPQFSLVDEG